ncbi:flagellar biosynthetic protein FliR [Pseudomethylobacillus aquaticus]|uniref:flagellar biosynthetic protein FliR n=1 Tax=Pseudomethylobacillus aquaticus TaxID=2676064 RepID=UPI00138FFE6F|nr:flagellar biosynthetic protein FliR [Pseudomethylobacillus aquaticus]
MAAALFNWALAVLLISIRLSTLFIATPIFAGIPVPNMARVLLVLGISLAFANTVYWPELGTVDLAWLVSAAVAELIIGAAMASVLFAGFAAFHFGGRLLDFQIGFGLAGLVDIATRNNMPLVGSILSMLAVLMFFLIDGHLAMLQVLQLSFMKLPLGAGIANLDIGVFIAYFGACFSLGFAIVAPVVLCLLLIDIGMAFMSRTMPQMNVFILSLGLKVIVGLIILAIVVPFSGGIIHMLFDSIFTTWGKAVT